jgi:hypothetical protein
MQLILINAAAYPNQHPMSFQGQRTAFKKLRADLLKFPKNDVRVVVNRAKQAHVKRRQEFDPKQGDAKVQKRKRIGEMGDMSNFPGSEEHCIMAFSGPIPEQRAHRTPMPGIENSGYPQQLISLPDPNQLEPKVMMECKKLIFKPDADGNSRVRDASVALEKADVAGKVMVPLSYLGRDEAYLKNLLWLLGISQVILWGVGNGMLAWICCCYRIPILCIYENELK